MQPFIANLVAGAVKGQGNLYRFKDSITLGLVAVVWIAAFVTTYLTGLPESAGVIIGAVGNFAALVVTRLTPGAITPSMAERLEKQAESDTHEPKHAATGNWIDDARRALAEGS